MCTSRLRRVVGFDEGGTVVVEGLDGRRSRVSLLAYDGPEPGMGDWVVVHSGYALAPADEEEARAAVAELAGALRDARSGAPGVAPVPRRPPPVGPAGPGRPRGRTGAVGGDGRGGEERR